MEKKSGNQAPEEIKENDIEVCLGSSVLLVESGEEKGVGEEKREEREKSCAERNSATVNPEEECEVPIEKFFDLSSVSGVSIFPKKQKPQKKRTSASFEENQENQQHNWKKNKRELEKTVMPIPVEELNTILYDVGETSFDGFQNASRINQVMAVENDKSQLVRSSVTSHETRKQMHSKNKYEDLAGIHNRTYPISRNQAKDHIPLLEAEQKLSIQIQPVKKAKQSSSQNKLTTQTKVQDEKQSSVLALPSKDCTQSKNTDIYSDNSVSMPCFVPVAHNTLDKKLQLPFEKQSGTQKKKSTVGHMRNKKVHFVSEESLEDGHGEEQLDKKKILHPVKLRAELKRAKPQKVREISLPKSQNNVLYQEDSCEQHVTKKHLNVSVTPQNNEEPLSHGQLLPPLYNNEMFRRKLHPYNAKDSDSVLPENTNNLRRSKRIRIKPLEYWRGERVYYKMDTSGDFVNGGIIVPEEREPRKSKAKVVTKSVPEIGDFVNGGIIVPEEREPRKSKAKVVTKSVPEIGDFVNGGIIVPEEREPRKSKAKVVTKSVPEIGDFVNGGIIVPEEREPRKSKANVVTKSVPEIGDFVNGGIIVPEEREPRKSKANVVTKSVPEIGDFVNGEIIVPEEREPRKSKANVVTKSVPEIGDFVNGGIIVPEEREPRKSKANVVTKSVPEIGDFVNGGIIVPEEREPRKSKANVVTKSVPEIGDFVNGGIIVPEEREPRKSKANVVTKSVPEIGDFVNGGIIVPEEREPRKSKANVVTKSVPEIGDFVNGGIIVPEEREPRKSKANVVTKSVPEIGDFVNGGIIVPEEREPRKSKANVVTKSVPEIGDFVNGGIIVPEEREPRKSKANVVTKSVPEIGDFVNGGIIVPEEREPRKSKANVVTKSVPEIGDFVNGGIIVPEEREPRKSKANVVTKSVPEIGDFVNGGIIVPEEREPRKSKANVVTKSVPEIEDLHINSTFKPLVFEKASNQQILQECMHIGGSPVLCIRNEILSIYKYLNTPFFAAGKIILNPLKEKGYQYSLTDTLIFYIEYGKLLLKLCEQSYYLTDGNYFFIPPGNAYNIRNLLNKECVLLFTQLKGKEHFA